MIENVIITDVKYEKLINNKEIIISNDYSRNVFINGNEVLSMDMLIRELYFLLLDESFVPYEKEALTFEQTYDYLKELMYQISSKNIFTLNIIIDEYELMMQKVEKNNQVLNKETFKELLQDLAIYCENEIAINTVSRINLNIFISNEKIDYNKLKTLVNNEGYIDENLFKNF